jgi:tRNA/tmRNA/rRNA uracil-C5-methylase (TrmA/RlmC/RlmD family)
VIGIELSKGAVEDAGINASANGVTTHPPLTITSMLSLRPALDALLSSFLVTSFPCSFIQVIGIELSKGAVEDAAINASANGVINATFHCAKAEAVLAGILAEQRSSSSSSPPGLIAIVDPPRQGLHNECLRWVGGWLAG